MPQILPMWWVLIFMFISLVYLTVMSFLSESVLFSPRPYTFSYHKLPSWLK